MFQKMLFIGSCLYKAVIRTIDQDGIEHAGYMAFMVLLTIFPFLVFLLEFTSFFGASTLGAYFIQLILDSLPHTVINSIEKRIFEILDSPPENLMNLAVIGTIWTASSFVEGLRTILNRVNDVVSPPAYILRRLMSIVQFLLIIVFIVLIMLLLVLVPITLQKIPIFKDFFNNLGIYWIIGRYILVFGGLFFSVSSLYYLIPNVKMQYKNVMPGACITVLLWFVSARTLFAYISDYNRLNLIYGSLGGVIITLLFFYVINMFFIYGAEFNYLLTKSTYKK